MKTFEEFVLFFTGKELEFFNEKDTEKLYRCYVNSQYYNGEKGD